ncbi:CAP domain-containing protein [Devosia rhizoryzae]|uniref:CAP domain-containing protein n=1 Tax=Devosia rhizoryzae TaxID=2774137 RepID=A0ABX7C961_9HYPH|nr:CAP domain-containing protein [Devosia rhizoryzae]QQR40804.1 CAP domain-containing protein [Devosia rhizoryzae]
MSHRAFRAAAAVLSLGAVVAIAGCSSFGGSTPSSATALAPALSARMDQPNAVLDSQQAIGLINAYRATNNLPPLVADAGLNGTAQALASQYAQTNVAPTKPQALAQMKLSAGYATFAETFSGWRNNPADAVGLLASASKAGVAVAFNPSSSYGIYWVLVLGN